MQRMNALADDRFANSVVFHPVPDALTATMRTAKRWK
jgi:hypothetical protein